MQQGSMPRTLKAAHLPDQLRIRFWVDGQSWSILWKAQIEPSDRTDAPCNTHHRLQ